MNKSNVVGKEDPVEAVIRRMAEPSWRILSVLDPTEPIHGYEILQRVDRLYKTAGFPLSLDPSTLHRAVKRMVHDGLIKEAGWREVDVPGPRGLVRREPRATYLITGLGSHVLERKRRLELGAFGTRPIRALVQTWAGTS